MAYALPRHYGRVAALPRTHVAHHHATTNILCSTTSRPSFGHSVYHCARHLYLLQPPSLLPAARHRAGSRSWFTIYRADRRTRHLDGLNWTFWAIYLARFTRRDSGRHRLPPGYLLPGDTQQLRATTGLRTYAARLAHSSGVLPLPRQAYMRMLRPTLSRFPTARGKDPRGAPTPRPLPFAGAASGARINAVCCAWSTYTHTPYTTLHAHSFSIPSCHLHTFHTPPQLASHCF